MFDFIDKRRTEALRLSGTKENSERRGFLGGKLEYFIADTADDTVEALLKVEHDLLNLWPMLQNPWLLRSRRPSQYWPDQEDTRTSFG